VAGGANGICGVSLAQSGGIQLKKAGEMLASMAWQWRGRKWQRLAS